MNHEKLDIILCKLKILSKLEPGEKIIISDSTIEIIDFNTYNFGRFKKWYQDETRYSTRKKLRCFYQDIEELIQTLSNNPPPIVPEEDIYTALERLHKDLTLSLKGLKNLTRTYNHDKTTSSELETITERVKILTQKITTHFERKQSSISKNPETEMKTSEHTEIPTDLEELLGSLN